jgi:hypothetical protein
MARKVVLWPYCEKISDGDLAFSRRCRPAERIDQRYASFPAFSYEYTKRFNVNLFLDQAEVAGRRQLSRVRPPPIEGLSREPKLGNQVAS